MASSEECASCCSKSRNFWTYHLDNHEFIFQWKIENMDCWGQYYPLISPTFVANCLDKSKWFLFCIIKNNTKNGKYAMYPCIHLSNENEPHNISVSYEFSLFDGKNKILETLSARKYEFCRDEDDDPEEKLVFSLPEENFSKIEIIQCRLWKNGIELCGTELGFARTRLCIERRVVKWTVENFCELKKKIKVFELDSKKCTSTSVSLFLNASLCKGTELHVLLSWGNGYTICDSWKGEYCYCIAIPYVKDCQISIVDCEGTVMALANKKCKVSSLSICKSHENFCFEFELFDNLLKKDSLLLQCECDICFGVDLNQLEGVNGTFKECNDDFEIQQDFCERATSSCTSASNFMKDMQQLFTQKQFCDFNLKTESEIFPVHRSILSARSPVFNAIFSHDMKESANQSVDIPDLNVETVRRMLAYMYTDKVDNLTWKDALDLYIAGDKYQMLNLKERCVSILKSNLHESNVCEILVLADERHDKDLKREAQDFIADNEARIINLDSWKDIETNYPSLGFEILRQIIIKKQKV